MFKIRKVKSQKRSGKKEKLIGKKIIHRENVEKVDFFVEFVEKTVYFQWKMCYTIITISICVLAQFYYYM